MNFRTPVTDEFLDNARLEGDAIADQVILDLVAKYGANSAKSLFDKLIRDIDFTLDFNTPSLTQFYQTTHSVSGLLDAKSKKLSFELFQDHGPKMLIILYFKSLPILYTNKNGSQVLVQTGRLAHNAQSMEVFSRRIAETGQFLIQVLDQNGLENNGDGIKAIQKIRLIHASVRYFVKQHVWNKNLYGTPINQEDLALTLLTFSHSILEGLEQLKIEITPQMQLAYLKKWAAIGQLLGIKKELIPENLDDAKWLIDKILSRQAKTSLQGQTLTKALIYFSEKTIPGTFLDITPRALIQFFIGFNYAKMLNAHSWFYTIAQFIPNLLLALFGLGEKFEAKNHRIEWLAHKFSILVTRSMVEFFNIYKDQKFEIKEALKIKWHV